MSYYNDAEKVLKSLENKKTSLKKVVFNSKFGNKKRLFAMVCGTLNYRQALEQILEFSGFQKRAKLSKEICLLLVYDHLFGKGVNCSGRLKKSIVSNKSSLHSALVRVKVRNKVSKNEDLAQHKSSDENIKYCRVNTLITNMESVIEVLESEGYNKVDTIKVEEKQFYIDTHIENLIRIKIQKDFTKGDLYLSGKLIIQDKASCMPAFVLSPPKNSTVIDACAAPGNKTSHLAAIMGNTGKIYAFDISSERLKTMNMLLEKAKVTNCATKNQDFLKSKPQEYSEVEHILLDPSCSGSGIVNRLSDLTDSAITPERLTSLHNFQTKILNHAFSFPSVKSVVYSTCSIHKEENELVVQEVLEKNRNFKLKKILPSWKGRGDKSVFDDAESTIRCNPNQHFTNGFYVALFVRT